MGKVAALKSPANDEAEEMVPPFSIGITISLAQDRQVHISSPVTDPVSIEEANRRADLLVRVAERQRAIFDIRYDEADLANKQAALNDVWLKRKAEAEAKHQEALSEIEAKVVEEKAKQTRIEADFVAAERARGRTGEIKLVGNVKNRYEAKGRDVGALADKVKAAEAEHLQNMQQIDGTIEQLSHEIAAIERKLKKSREIAG